MEKANAAEAAVEAATNEANQIEEELVAKRESAAREVQAAEAEYADEESTRNTLTIVGLVIVACAVLAAVAIFAVKKLGSWPISNSLTQLIGVVLGVILVAGLALTFVPSTPTEPSFSDETLELANAAEGDPADPPSEELEEARAAEEPLAEAAEPLEESRRRAEMEVRSAEGGVASDRRKLVAAEGNVKNSRQVMARIEAIELEEAQFREEATTIDYAQLIKNPERFRGEKVVYTGQIFQIQEEAGYGIMLLSVTDEGYGFWTDEIWVNFEDPVDAAEEDIVTVYGKLTGSEEYETRIGGTNYVPRMNAKYVDE
jgi:hypothetical protein